MTLLRRSWPFFLPYKQNVAKYMHFAKFLLQVIKFEENAIIYKSEL